VIRQTLTYNHLPSAVANIGVAKRLRNTRVLVVDTVVRPGLYKVLKVMCTAAPELGVIELEERWLKNVRKGKK